MTIKNLRHEKIRLPGQPICRLCGVFFDETVEGVCPQKLARVMELPQDEQGRVLPERTLRTTRGQTMKTDEDLQRELNQARSLAATWRTRHLNGPPERQMDLFPWELDPSDLPPGWRREREDNGSPGSRWVSYLVRPEVRLVEDCNPEADVVESKLDNALQKAWEIHEAKV